MSRRGWGAEGTSGSPMERLESRGITILVTDMRES
mgnify:CR=1 FL=1